MARVADAVSALVSIYVGPIDFLKSDALNLFLGEMRDRWKIHVDSFWEEKLGSYKL